MFRRSRDELTYLKAVLMDTRQQCAEMERRVECIDRHRDLPSEYYLLQQQIRTANESDAIEWIDGLAWSLGKIGDVVRVDVT